MKVNVMLKMRELELQNGDVSDSNSDYDEDFCDVNEINKLFVDCATIGEKSVAADKYILQITATLESEPNVAVTLSNNTCEVYKLGNNQFAKSSIFSEHSDVISEIKFSHENNNLLYTGSYDGTVRLWDLRTPKKSTVQFKDTTTNQNKQICCFDLSPNSLLLAAGTNLFEAEAFVLFWDVRKASFLGGYWESHTDDITQIKFHQNDSNKLISGSVDGLINLYDLSQKSEDDALIDSLNTESSIEKLNWLQGEIISCITHTADIQFWKIEDAQPYCHLHRCDIAKNIKRKSEEHIYVVDVHKRKSDILVLSGSNFKDGECFRGLSVSGKTISSSVGFTQNKQRVRSSWLNSNLNLLLTGGEKGILNAWKLVN